MWQTCRRSLHLRRVGMKNSGNVSEKVLAQSGLILIPTCRRIYMIVVQWAERPHRSPKLHPSIEQYLEVLHTKRCARATLKVVRQNLTHSIVRWEYTRRRTLDPVLLRYKDLRDWRLACQRDDGAAPATINRGLASLHGYCQWTILCHLLTEETTS